MHRFSRRLVRLLSLPVCSVFFVFAFPSASSAQAGPLGLVLPTDNDAIFSDDPSQFYMYTTRNFEGVASTPWTGGTYGFSRNLKRTSIGVIGTRFHEGVDIRPVRRDSAGEPLDEVRAIARGTVVYVNGSAGASNYGRYIVVHHDWGDGPFFSLYAHLSTPLAEQGQVVEAGQSIAKMGYTGAGINRTRAHVHLELAFLLNDRFQQWYDLHFTSENRHGIFNGFNLLGMDVAGLYLAHRSRPDIAIPEYLASHGEIYYKVLVPKRGQLEFLRRYPFLGRGGGSGLGAQSWEFSFARSGVPLEIRPSKQRVGAPVVSWVKPTATNHSYLTSGRITGTGDSAKLTASGSRFIQLIAGGF